MPFRLKNRRAPRWTSIAENMIMPSRRVTACYGLSADPPTNGHLWIIEAAAKLFARVVVAVGVNHAKTRKIEIPDAAAILAVECSRIARTFWRRPGPCPEIIVSVCPRDLYMADFARKLGASVMVRGLRGADDLPLELMIGDFARRRCGLDTVLLTPPPELRALSSSYVRGLVGPKGWLRIVRPLVPPGTIDLLKKGLTNDQPTQQYHNRHRIAPAPLLRRALR